MARWFIVSGTAGVAFRYPMPVHGAKSACDPFLPHCRLRMHYTPVDFSFSYWGVWVRVCFFVQGGFVQVPVVYMGRVLVPAIALVALAEISLRSFVISLYWVLLAVVSR